MLKKPSETSGHPEKSDHLRKKVSALLMAGFLTHAAPIQAEAESIQGVQPFPAKPHSIERHKMTEVMDEKEIISMQKAQTALLRNYLNPSYVLLLKTLGIFEQANEAIEMALRHSKELAYKESLGSITITKRPTDPKNTIPNDFSITLKDGWITKINETSIDPTGSESFRTFMKRMVNSTTLMMKYLGAGANETDRIIAEAYLIDLPHRLKKALDLRNAEGNLYPSEITGPGWAEFEDRLNKHPKNKEELKSSKNPEGKNSQLFVFVYPDNPKKQNIIEIVRPKTEGFKKIIAFSPEGFVLNLKKDGSWELPKEYENAFKDRYKNPQEPKPFPLPNTSFTKVE